MLNHQIAYQKPYLPTEVQHVEKVLQEALQTSQPNAQEKKANQTLCANQICLACHALGISVKDWERHYWDKDKTCIIQGYEASQNSFLLQHACNDVIRYELLSFQDDYNAFWALLPSKHQDAVRHALQEAVVRTPHQYSFVSLVPFLQLPQTTEEEEQETKSFNSIKNLMMLDDLNFSHRPPKGSPKPLMACLNTYLPYLYHDYPWLKDCPQVMDEPLYSKTFCVSVYKWVKTDFWRRLTLPHTVEKLLKNTKTPI